MNVAFCTHVSDDWFYTIGADKLLKSAKHFHPEIPFYVFNSEQIQTIFDSHENFNWTTIHPAISIQLIDEYDMVVHLDADCIITGKLDELLDEDNLNYDIIGVRNNNHFKKAGKDSAIFEKYSWDTYLNCGLVGVTNKSFLEKWIDYNLSFGNMLSFQEQSVLNRMVHEEDWKHRMLDPVDGNVYYGLSNAWGERTHWDSWKEIKIVNDELILDNKVVKILHQAGGSAKNKLQPNMFNQETLSYFNKIELM